MKHTNLTFRIGTAIIALIGLCIINNYITNGSNSNIYNYLILAVQIGIAVWAILTTNRTIKSATKTVNVLINDNFNNEIKDIHINGLGSFSHSFDNLLHMFNEKKIWFEGILDAIPFPLSVTDLDMNWTFINKPVEDFLKVKRIDVLGQQCENWNANICRTENCGVHRLRNGFTETFFNQLGLNFKVDTTYILNSKGEKIGHVEAVQDITSLARVNEYMKTEVQRLGHDFEKMATGDLSFTSKVGEGDEFTKEASENFDSLDRSFNKTLEKLNEQLLKVNMASSFVSSGAQQMALASESVAQGATEQASTVQEVSSSMQEVGAMTHQNTLNAKEALELSQNTRESAKKSTQSMSQLSDAITKIKNSSDQISKIINSIDEIAFQTNLLALNAAVEAARAGEAGKGFAVVAEEVRNLAIRSAEAAKNTSDMIQDAIKNSDQGVHLNNEVSTVLDELINQVIKVEEVVAEIASASEQQNNGINQVNEAMEQINQVTQQNSANAEETASVSKELTSHALELKDLVDLFNLKKEYIKNQSPVVEQTNHYNNDRKSTKESTPSQSAEQIIPFDDDQTLNQF